MTETIDIFKRRRDKAKNAWEMFLTEMRDAYAYAFPGGVSVFDAAKEREVYDAVAARAVRFRVKKIHASLFPPYKEFLDFNPADPSAADDNGEQWDKLYVEAKRNCHKAIEASNFHTEVEMSLGDAMISYGALALRKGTPQNPFVFEAIHPAAIYPGRSFDGIVREMFREQKIAGNEIRDYWPTAKADSDILDSPQEQTVCDGYLWDVQKREYRYIVTINDKIAVDEDHLKTAEICIFRMDGKTGDNTGFGPVLSVLPDIRSADKTKELLLRKAAFDLGGLYQAEDESIVNVESLDDLRPGTVIFKRFGSKGLESLYNGAGFDLSQMVISDLHAGIEEAIKGPSLPSENSGSRRSAYEYQVRQGEIDAVDIPTGLRLMKEMEPLFYQMLEILTADDMADSPYYIRLPKITDKNDKEKKRLLEIVPISPMIRKQDELDSQRALQGYALANQIDPVIASAIVDKEKFIRKILDDTAFPTECMRSEDETKTEIERMNAAAQSAAENREADAAVSDVERIDPENMTDAAGVMMPEGGFF
nr:MAG TPA: head to tail connecting protein [Caudoviricetes sp.]